MNFQIRYTRIKHLITSVFCISALLVFYTGKICMFFYACLGLVVVASVIVFIIIPLVFLCFPSIMKGFILVSDTELPSYNEYNNPGNYGFVGRNLYLTTKDSATLGVWHLLPTVLEEEGRELNSSQVDTGSRAAQYDNWLSDATVMVYLHGSAGTRTSGHRLRTYHLLGQLGYHVVTFDYRGYGDSTSSPSTETDLTIDTMEVLTWVQDRVKSGNIFLWGHSLGTGVASRVAELLSTSNKPRIQGLILEAPFNNMAAGVRASPLVEMISVLPWFDYCFLQPLHRSDLAFQSDHYLRKISTPVLILHAKDDKVIPYSFAEKLYKDVSAFREDPSTIKMISYNSSLGYGHYNITLDPNLGNELQKFVENIFAELKRIAILKQN